MREVVRDFDFSSYLFEPTKLFLTAYLQRFASFATKKNYCNAICEFCDFVTADLTQISKEDCKRYLLHLESKRQDGLMKNSTVNKKRYQISSVLNTMCTPHYRELLHLPEEFENFFLDLRTDIVDDSFHYNKVPAVNELDVLYRYLLLNDHMTCAAFLLSFKGFLTMEEFRRLSVDDFFEDANGHMVVRIQSVNPESVRYNSIPDDVRTFLLSYFDTLCFTDGKQFLFSKCNGALYSARWIRQRLQSACNACGIKSFSFNDFRNAATVYAVSNHADVTLVANSLGYRTNAHIHRLSSLTITMNDAVDYLGVSFKPVAADKRA